MSEWDDSVYDAVALVEAVRADQAGDIAVLLRACNPYGVTVALAKMVSELVAANERGEAACSDPECLRAWALEAMRR